MSRSIVTRLIFKDLYLLRWPIVGATVAGGAALAVMPLSKAAGYVGGVSLICALIVLNIFLVMNGVVQERKDKVLLFVLSLPVSTTQYLAAKVTANTVAFLLPWLILTAAAAVVIDATALPNGILPFWLTVLVYLLTYYLVLLGVSLVTDSTGWHATAITLGNVSVNFLIVFLLGLPSVVANGDAPTAVWTADIVTILAIELAAGAAALGLGIYFASRRPDFV
jgi:ABC-type transport system involved in multi-copper enzyme maturation permease subunit